MTTRHQDDHGLASDMDKLDRIFEEARKKIVSLISRREKRLVKSILASQKPTRKKDRHDKHENRLKDTRKDDRVKDDRVKDDRVRDRKVEKEHSDSTSDHSDA